MAGGFEADRADQPPRPEFATCQDGMGHPIGADLRGAQLQGANLGYAELQGGDLER